MPPTELPRVPRRIFQSLGGRDGFAEKVGGLVITCPQNPSGWQRHKRAWMTVMNEGTSSTTIPTPQIHAGLLMDEEPGFLRLVIALRDSGQGGKMTGDNHGLIMMARDG